jgi:hypothetical protein
MPLALFISIRLPFALVVRALIQPRVAAHF